MELIVQCKLFICACLLLLSMPSAWKYSRTSKQLKFSTPLRLNMVHNQALGSIALVGAGPGDPDLLTIQALKLIKNASLVISDRLVSKEILDMIDCEVKIARKRPGCAEEAQEEIYEWVKEAILAGRNVVRLKIGDPFLFGRGGEEILEFRKLGIEATVAAGISSSYCAPLIANIPLTHRGVSSQVLISTGYGRESKYIDIPEYHADRTVVLLMAIGRLEEIALNMTTIGYPESTPVAIVEKATMSEERVVTGTLKNIAVRAKEEDVKAPATIVIGGVVSVLREHQTTDILEVQLVDNAIKSSNETHFMSKQLSLI